jgi:N4-gp56 family major capsid protein
MLDALYDSVYFMPYGEKITIPRHAGAKVSARRMEMMATTKVALTEGLNPDAIDLTINEVNGTVAEYGTWVKISSFLDLVGLDPILSKLSAFLGDHAGLTQDEIVRDVLAAGANKIWGGNATKRNGAGGSPLEAGDVMTTAVIQAARQEMVENNVKQLSLPDGGKGWIAFASPSTITRIMNLTEWKDQNTYVNIDNRKKGIVGQMYGIYFVEATTAATFADGGTSSNLAGQITTVLGKGAFAVADIDGSAKPELIMNTSADSGNPLGMYKTVGWKSCFVAFILNANCLINIETLDV